MTAKASDIAALVELFAASEWDELHVDIDGLQLFLSTDPYARLSSSTRETDEARSPDRNRRQDRADGLATVDMATLGARAEGGGKAADAAGGAAPRAVATDCPEGWIAVTAPNLGTFYRAPKPGAPPYVEEGQSVQPDTALCLLEVMKLFTAVHAGIQGVMRRICVEDGQMVEFGQTLFYLEPR